MRPAFDLRKVPPTIYLALGIRLVGGLVFALAYATASGSIGERLEAIERWRAFEMGCEGAATLLLALGLIDLGRRQLEGARGLTIVAAILGTAGMAWWGYPLILQILDPHTAAGYEAVHTWMGRLVGVVLLTSAVLITIAADAWRRVLVAAIGLIFLQATAGWVPWIGELITAKLGHDYLVYLLYGLARTAAAATALLFIAGALAARGPELGPDPRAAVSGLQVARTGLWIRLVMAALAALAALATLGGRSPVTLRTVFVFAPALAVATALVFAIGIARAAAARLDGLPRWLLAVGVALVLWWTTIQLGQVIDGLAALRRDDDAGLAKTLGMFAIAGPVAANVGFALIGSGLVMWIRTRGDAAAIRAAERAAIGFVVLTAAGLGAQSFATHAHSFDGVVMMLVLGAAAMIAGLAALAGLLGRAAASLDAGPQLPTARVI